LKFLPALLYVTPGKSLSLPESASALQLIKALLNQYSIIDDVLRSGLLLAIDAWGMIPLSPEKDRQEVELFLVVLAELARKAGEAEC